MNITGTLPPTGNLKSNQPRTQGFCAYIALRAEALGTRLKSNLKASPSLSHMRRVREHEYAFLKTGLKFTKHRFLTAPKINAFIQVKLPSRFYFSLFLFFGNNCSVRESQGTEHAGLDHQTLVSGLSFVFKKKICSLYKQFSISYTIFPI